FRRVPLRAPRIAPAIDPARRLLPFGLRWQPPARPLAVGRSVVPRHLHDRMVSSGERAWPARVPPRRALRVHPLPLPVLLLPPPPITPPLPPPPLLHA